MPFAVSLCTIRELVEVELQCPNLPEGPGEAWERGGGGDLCEAAGPAGRQAGPAGPERQDSSTPGQHVEGGFEQLYWIMIMLRHKETAQGAFFGLSLCLYVFRARKGSLIGTGVRNIEYIDPIYDRFFLYMPTYHSIFM